MKAGSGSILWLAVVFALVMVVKGLEAGSVLEPALIDPAPPNMIGAPIRMPGAGHLN